MRDFSSRAAISVNDNHEEIADISPPCHARVHDNTLSVPSQNHGLSPVDVKIMEALNAVPHGTHQSADFSRHVRRRVTRTNPSNNSVPITSICSLSGSRSSDRPSISEPPCESQATIMARVCSQHGLKGTWNMSDPCEECIAIAMSTSL